MRQVGNGRIRQRLQKSILDTVLSVREQEDFDLHVELQGSTIPQRVELEVEGRRVPLVKQEGARFTHRFRSVQAPVEFTLAAEGFRSRPYLLNTDADRAAGHRRRTPLAIR